MPTSAKRRLLADVHDPATRSRNMAAIRAKNTGLELTIRKGLHARGFRFRLHSRRIVGSPDLVLSKHGALVDVRGCFFHGHNCALFKMPQSRREFWSTKIAGN